MALNCVGSVSANSGLAPRRPSLIGALGELRFPLEASMFFVQALMRPWPHAEPGRGRTVMLIPGFMAGDVTLLLLANFLRRLGHRAVFGGIWSNSKCPRATLDELASRLVEVYDRAGEPVAIVGHSLGGLYARELAHRLPAEVDRVITLGAPLRRPRDAANLAVQAVARSMAAIRGRAEGCLSEACTCGLSIHDDFHDAVPTTVIYSRSDGVVHWESCVNLSGSEMVENIEVTCSHVGMAFSAEVYRAIAERLVLPPREHARAAHRNGTAPANSANWPA